MAAVSSRLSPYLLLMSLLLSLLSGSLQASVFDKLIASSDGPLPVDKAYRFSDVAEGDGVYRLNWQIEDGYYLYRDKIKLMPDDGIEVVEVRYPDSKSKQDPLFGDVQVYYHQLELLIRLRSTETPINDAQLQVEYQGCWEGGICYPPVMKKAKLGFVPVEAAPFPAATVSSEQSDSQSDSGFALSLTDPRQVIAQLSSGNFWLTLGLFYLAGLALSLTPCVFPMVPILAGVIAGHSGVMTTRKALMLSFVYVMAMSLTYTLVGVLAGLFGANLQASFQSPWIISVFSGLFVLLALAMFGFYELQMPASIQNKLDRISRSQQGGHLAGVAIMGFLSALIVGPCVAAPLAGALIYIGQTGDPVLGGWALFVLSLGMGTPLLVVGASAGKLLPKAGGWMERVKQFFGVALLLLAVWMLDRIVTSQVTMVLLAAVLIGCAVFMRALDRLDSGASAAARLAKATGVLLLIYAVMLLVGVGSGKGSLLKPLDGLGAEAGRPEAQVSFTRVTSWEQLEPILEQAKRQQAPVMLDFYADWCVSCKELELYTFADSVVVERLGKFVTIKVDVTANDSASKALYERYQLVGPPALIFYDRQGVEHVEAMLVGVPSPADFADHLATFL